MLTSKFILPMRVLLPDLEGNHYRDDLYEYYANERKKDNNPKATSPFILAALELNR